MKPLELFSELTPSQKVELELRLDQQAAQRARYLSVLIAAGTLAFALNSVSALQIFKPSLTPSEIVLWRTFLGVIPFLLFFCLDYYPKLKKFANVRVFTVLYVFSFVLQALVDIWPIAWGGRADILLFVGSVNSIYICAAQILLALPGKHFMFMAILVICFIWVPITSIGALKSEDVFRMTVVNDISLAVGLGLSGSFIVSRLYQQLELLRLRFEIQSRAFLGKPLQRAIFDGKTQHLQAKKRDGFIAVVDIRDSTKLSRTHGQRWNNFFETFISHVSQTVEHYDGTYIKSTGDGFILAFGLFRDDIDLSDLPGIEEKEAHAKEEIWTDLTRSTLNCFEDIYQTFLQLSHEHFPKLNIKIGVGIDRGAVDSGVRGSQTHLEFDVWGDKVNIAAKIEALTKSLSSNEPDSVLTLALSPYASDYLTDYSTFQRVMLTDGQISGSPNIKWLLVRRFRRPSTISDTNAA